jgi:hypothetical protein
MRWLPIVLLAGLSPLAVNPAQAQSLETGKWTGTVTAPGEQSAMPVEFDVTLKGDTLGITVRAGEHGTFAFNEAKLDDRTLTFWFMPGPRVDCTLLRGEDETFSGSCRDSEGGIASMVMVPPKKE